MTSLIVSGVALLCLIIVAEFLVRVYYLRRATPKRLADLRRDLVHMDPSNDQLGVMVKHLGRKTFGGGALFGFTRGRFLSSIRLGLRFPSLQNADPPHFDPGVAAAVLGMVLDRRSIPLLFREQRRLGPRTRAAWALAVMGDKGIHRRLVELHSAGEMSDREWREIERIVMESELGTDAPAMKAVRLSALEKAAKTIHGNADSYNVFHLARILHNVEGEEFSRMRKAREVVGNRLLGELKDVASKFQQGLLDFADATETASGDTPPRPDEGLGGFKG